MNIREYKHKEAKRRAWQYIEFIKMLGVSLLGIVALWAFLWGLQIVFIR